MPEPVLAPGSSLPSCPRHEPMTLALPHWTDPLPEPGPDAPPVQIWRLCLSDLDPAPMETLRRLTTPSEHARAQRYRFDADRHRHLAGRALVRLFVARTYERALQEISIREGRHGKPQLAGSDEEIDLEFNIAHTDDVVLAAFSRTHPVGIDVEAQDREADMDGLAERIFTKAEQRHWTTLPDDARSEFFFQIWTCKEAFLKATGQGLQRAPETVECTFDDDTVVALRETDDLPNSDSSAAHRWAVRPFSVSDRLAGAVVRKNTLPTPLLFVDASRLVTQRAHC